MVLALLVAAGASYRFDLGPRWFGFGAPSPQSNPAAVAPPAGLVLPDLTDPLPVAVPAEGDSAAAARVRRVLAPALDDPDLGPQVLARVARLGDGHTLFSSGEGVAVPASTMKLLTATAALAELGPDHTFATTVVHRGRHGIVLVGGGDPFLASAPASDPTYPARADMVTLARSTAEALHEQGVRRVRVGYDDSLFSGPRTSPRWPADYLPDGVVSPITALWVDEGRPSTVSGRFADPSASAAATFAAALASSGVEVLGQPAVRRAAPDATTLASVQSAPLAEIVEQVLAVSDNEAAEVLAHQVGVARSGRGSFAGGAAGVRRVLDELGIPLAGARVYDGSGLSREDRLAPITLIAVLRTAAGAEHPELRTVVTGLPVAGFSGSLAERFTQADPRALGRVRAKTGTLSGVSGLAGIATDLDGEPLVFVLMADRVALADTLDARDALDAIAAALGACRCGSPA